MPYVRSRPLAPPMIEVLNAAPATMRRPLALIDGRAYAGTWLYVRISRSETRGRKRRIIKHDPPLVETGTQLFIVRDDGVIFGAGGMRPMEDLGLEVALPEAPHLSRTWSTAGVEAYRTGERPDPAEVFSRVADVVGHFVDFDRSLADQRTMAEMVACYVLATWFLDAFHVIGYLWPNGERGSGKTVLLHTVAEMAYLGHVVLAGGSYASLRDLAEYGATLAFDDAENLAEAHRSDADKRALLLAGNRRGSTVTMKEQGPGKERRTRHVNAFCPRLFSAIQAPDNVLSSRSIVIPLVRTTDRRLANIDPLDHETWPHERRPLIDDLWALALAHLPELRAYERAVSEKVRLAGRTLEPWRAILAVALWLDEQDEEEGTLRRSAVEAEDETDEEREEGDEETGLWERMEALSVAYQRERAGLETGNLTVLVIQALCCCAVNAGDDSGSEGELFPASFVCTTEEVTMFAVALAEKYGGEVERITNRRVGQAMGRMRLEKAPRPGGKGSRRWRVTRGDLERWMAAYGVALSALVREDGW